MVNMGLRAGFDLDVTVWFDGSGGWLLVIVAFGLVI